MGQGIKKYFMYINNDFIIFKIKSDVIILHIYLMIYMYYL